MEISQWFQRMQKNGKYYGASFSRKRSCESEKNINHEGVPLGICRRPIGNNFRW